MHALRNLKLSVLTASKALGLFRLAENSRRRGRELLILCYHGISIADEHEWRPGLYLSAEVFASRLESLRRRRSSVLPLAEAVRRLYDGTLPPRSVAITFDDGNYDFYARAWPLLREHQLPVTVYLTTYYCERNLPVFPLVISYLLWKARDTRVSFSLTPDANLAIDARSPSGRREAQSALLRHAQQNQLTAQEKDAFAARLANHLRLDYDDILNRRLLRIMKPEEVSELSAAGVDFQLHTHRHRSPLDRDRYRAEVRENCNRVAGLTGAIPRHFCYPSGMRMPAFESWLREEGVTSATTCHPGLASAQSGRLNLPRVLDHSDMTAVEFEAWLSGAGAFLPHRPIGEQQVDEDGWPVIPAAATPGVAPEDDCSIPDGGDARSPGAPTLPAVR